MYFSLPIGIKLIVENNTSKQLGPIHFYANGDSINGAMIKSMKPSERKFTAIITPNLILAEDSFALSLSIAEYEPRIHVMSNMQRTFAGEYIITLHEDIDGNVYISCEEFTDN